MQLYKNKSKIRHLSFTAMRPFDQSEALGYYSDLGFMKNGD